MTKLKTVPTFEHEQRLIDAGYRVIAGVDEVGRGPLCGPVTAAAVILPFGRIPQGLNDSKKVPEKKRREIYDHLLAHADVSVAHASVEEIDDINILQASMLAMERAVAGLRQKVDFVLVDGNKIPKALDGRAEALVKGDSKSQSIAAASIMAKVSRDAIMQSLAQQYPGYGWEKNAGYPTKAHMEALATLGVTPHHRRSYKPIHKILYQEN